MVLKRASAALLLAACIHKAPPRQLPQTAPVATALLVDAADSVEPLPGEVEETVLRAISDRNLEPRQVDAAAALGGARSTQQRMSLLAKASDAPYVLLLETRVTYYDVLQGRFRWVVRGRITVARRDDLQGAASAEFEAPVFLLYEHDKEPEALRAAAPAIADRAGALLDDFLAVPPVKTSALYFILIDRFANGDRANDGAVDLADPQAFHGGDLQGVIDHLDELKSLGVRDIWLSPLFRMRTEKFFGFGAFHGYWTEDLRSVEPRFGDEALLQRLSNAMHQRGMRLYLDLVLNHVAPEGELTRAHPGWFHHQGSITDWNDPAQLETRDVSGLPDLAQENPQVYEYLLAAAEKWLPYADGYRLDAVKHVPLQFWSRFNRALHEAKPQLRLLGEALDGDPSRLARYQREGGFDQLFDFPAAFALTDVFCKGAAPAKLGAVLSLDRLYPDAAGLVTLLDDHDLPRIAGQCGADLEKVRDALLVQLTLRGTPMISYGTESAQPGLREPDNRADMNFAQQPLRPWIAQLLALRRAHPALDHGAQRVLSLDGDALWLARVASDEVVAVRIGQGPLPPQLAGARLLLETGRCALFARAGTLPPPQAQREILLRGTTGALVVGAGPELGSWDPAHGVPVGARLMLPGSTIAEFKLVQRRADGSIQWEKGGNRYFFVPEGQGPAVLDLEWRS